MVAVHLPHPMVLFKRVFAIDHDVLFMAPHLVRCKKSGKEVTPDAEEKETEEETRGILNEVQQGDIMHRRWKTVGLAIVIASAVVGNGWWAYSWVRDRMVLRIHSQLLNAIVAEAERMGQLNITITGPNGTRQVVLRVDPPKATK